ncbi:hypothetical protein [Xanthomonas citri]
MPAPSLAFSMRHGVMDMTPLTAGASIRRKIDSADDTHAALTQTSRDITRFCAAYQSRQRALQSVTAMQFAYWCWVDHTKQLGTADALIQTDAAHRAQRASAYLHLPPSEELCHVFFLCFVARAIALHAAFHRVW